MKIGNHTIKYDSIAERFDKLQWEAQTQAFLINLCKSLIVELDIAFENFHVTNAAYVRQDGQIRAMQVGIYEI